MNKSDGERVAAVLEELGFVPTTNESEANLIFTMACSVRQTAIDRIHGRLRNWEHMKRTRPILTVLSGCVLPDDKEYFRKKFDILLDTKDINQLPALLTDTQNIRRSIIPSRGTQVVQYLSLKPKYSSTFQAFVPIMSGCDKFCTYCAVPFTRGREVSRPSKEILDEVQALVVRGYKQITLLGQNVNSYGLDTQGREPNFAKLLQLVAAIAGDFWIHYTSPHPRDMTDDVLDAMAASPKIAKQIHLPLQAGSTAVLKRMNRTYTQGEYLRLMHRIRSRFPYLALSTDIIVGFPGETAAQFEETRKVFREARFDMAYIAQYSPRPNTPAAKVFSDDVLESEKKRRFEVLTADLSECSFAYHQSLLHSTIRILIEKYSTGFYFGKTEGLKNIRVPAHDFDHGKFVGTFQEIRVQTVSHWHLQGAFVESFIPVKSLTQ
ncbi:MAG: tRNA (N6-isopentenyl adenosine(37)-C2)-methylthiotransferase MiaB [Candidatus Kerfeldbacteria bacterium RIFCSPHIGHO2_02_FULL_42_14]|uniref:tRNA (N6-isopentenyl adenosine(37)-C2)-methylthiotransferase MiaB n=1 Tax=Candidatus Kerfeldbacteria bacterium RIFCSPHIGHO2_02_FULL_42_14 TaxID=1798540 RepID=A0A1G2ARA6_9BACT|nr:MAG: tRNA (N6-isopentenyl adenosine(37)-C2)-methylthiotransferase MiaB [Candidatus Kerfeldbacteria bacterium RIFCSPHIGHO2_02_FULL_42_14]OGY80711.1 MAG: tRNA (N6-isopentenyl adenosine(37)-C2)-methylthiotransferase MiaB [Candidatus Kerfeldbacteria bacterium RIFCSPHIGHO2_12_FULL_42_13]OGY82637.1 MAG: tRNA (N6-isopentenyl adenosine(37)-C2)-methylthiotransferase MiaB [Candidatus Kerfeldbacteria bacterium RIFCSPLOWO2_02_FULL_42_19]OGY85241.1 MAG: tRNA (N6-isopentenyl adenosine(37)-C2)-methylthiotra